MSYTVLPVGQGTGTLIQVINDGGEPVTTILIDLGSRLWNQSVFGTKSTEVVTAALKKMVTSGPTLDAVFISHADEDHIDEIPKLLGQFSKPSEGKLRSETLVVNNVWYGGPDTSYAGKVQTGNVLKKLQKYAPVGKTNLKMLGSDISDLKKPLYSSGPNGVDIFVMIANTVAGNTNIGRSSTVLPLRSDQAYLANTISLVLLVRYGTKKQYIVATGDATGMTMAACNQRLAAEFTLQNWLKPVYSISLPHHGSAVTTYNVLDAATATKSTDDLAQQVVDEFVDYLEPETVTVSAGEVDAYKHPSYSVIDDFARYAADATYSDPSLGDEHFYTVYLETQELQAVVDMGYDKGPSTAKWPSRESWRTARTSKAVYTINYYEQDDRDPERPVPVIHDADARFGEPDPPYSPHPPWGCAWQFKISQDGKQVELSPAYAIEYELGDGEEELFDALLSGGRGAPPPELPVLIPQVRPPCPVPALVRVTAPSSAALPGRRRVRALL